MLLALATRHCTLPGELCLPMRQWLALARRPALNALISSCRAPELYCSSQHWRTRSLHTGRPVIQAAKASQQCIDVAAGRQKDTKRLARAYKAVPLCVLTVSKGGTAAEALAGVVAADTYVKHDQRCRAAEPTSPKCSRVSSAEEYAEKIRRYTAFTATQLRTNPKKSADPEVAIQAEGAKILQALQPQASGRSCRFAVLSASHVVSAITSRMCILLHFVAGPCHCTG